MNVDAVSEGGTVDPRVNEEESAAKSDPGPDAASAAAGAEGSDESKKGPDGATELNSPKEEDANVDVATEISAAIKSNVDPTLLEANNSAENNQPATFGEYDDILGNGLLKKKILKNGQGRASRPQPGCEVTVSVSGKMIDGTTIDEDPGMTFILGDGDVIQAFDLAVALMELEEKALIVTAAKYGYGTLGRGPDVPPNATIMYTVELLTHKPAYDYSVMPVRERLCHAEGKHLRGNWLYSRTDFICAINSYTKAIRIIEPHQASYNDTPEVLQELLECRIKCFNNMAACQLKVNAYDVAVKSCEEVLKFQPMNGKALFRLGKAFEGLGNIDVAVKFLKEALKYDNAKAVHAELSRLTKLQKQGAESEKKVYQKMFGGPAPQQSDAGKTTSNLYPSTSSTSGETSPTPVSSSSKFKWSRPASPFDGQGDPWSKGKKEKTAWSWMWYAGGAAMAVVVGVSTYRLFHH